METILQSFVTSSHAPTVFDYIRSDGRTAAQEPQCPHCETRFHSEHRDSESVIDRHGESYPSIDVPTHDGPFFCPPCWADLETNRLAQDI